MNLYLNVQTGRECIDAVERLFIQGSGATPHLLAKHVCFQYLVFTNNNYKLKKYPPLVQPCVQKTQSGKLDSRVDTRMWGCFGAREVKGRC